MRSVQNLFVLTLIGVFGMSLVVSAEDLNIVGTGSGTVVLQAVADAFMQQHPDVSISIPPSIGSGGGVKAVGRDEEVLGRVARGIKEKEEPYGLTYVEYANIPVVFFTNKSVEIEELSMQQVLDIYSGAVTNWSEVGGNDAKVRVVTREEGDSSLSVLLKSFPGFSDITITSKAKTTFSDPETEETVLNTANVIGYGSYPNVKALDVNVLTIEGKHPADADYPYAGPLGLIYKEANYTGAVKAFVEFALSEAAHEPITKVGGLHVGH
jgi:phosphate transport system substrate-binding protein